MLSILDHTHSHRLFENMEEREITFQYYTPEDLYRSIFYTIFKDSPERNEFLDAFVSELFRTVENLPEEQRNEIYTKIIEHMGL